VILRFVAVPFQCFSPSSTFQHREDWTIYWRPSYVTPMSQSYDSAPRPPPPKLDRRHTGRLRKRDSLLSRDGEGEGGRGAESQESLILSGPTEEIPLERETQRGCRYVVFVPHFMGRGVLYRTTTILWCVHFINCTPTFLHTQLHSQFNISSPRPVQLPTDAQTEPDNDNWDLFQKRRHPLS
jgi:hypothetical protein